MEIPWLAFAAGAASFFPVFAAAYRFRHLDPELRLLLIMFSAGVVNALLQFILAYLGHHNLFLAHFYLPIEFLFFLWVFSRWFGTPSRFVLRSISALFVLFWIVSHLTWEHLEGPARYTSLLSKILYVGITIVFLHRISARSEESILRDSRFWFLSGILIYASGGILFASLRNVIDKLPPDGLFVAYSVHWVIEILINMLYAIGFLCKPLNSGGQLELAR